MKPGWDTKQGHAWGEGLVLYLSTHFPERSTWGGGYCHPRILYSFKLSTGAGEGPVTLTSLGGSARSAHHHVPLLRENLASPRCAPGAGAQRCVHHCGTARLKASTERVISAAAGAGTRGSTLGLTPDRLSSSQRFVPGALVQVYSFLTQHT